MALVPGDRLGPYEALGLIGEGGMGEVYRARDIRLNRIVALKVLPTGLARDPDRRARLEREAQAIAALNHPHICTLFDIGEADDGTTYLVMEHLSGETLAARLHRGPLSLAQALATGAQIADALAAAHHAGIVHRDLKPANVMLVGGGPSGTVPNTSAEAVKLLDFGLAKLCAAGGEAIGGEPAQATIEALTAYGMILGTLPYMAPEQVQGQVADARTDIWALGAILYEMVSGARPFAGVSALALASAILERDPVPLASHQPRTPPALERLIRRCLAKHPADRWAAAHDVAEELRGLALDLSDPPRAAVPQRRRRFGRRFAIPLVIGAGAVGGFLWLTRTPATQSAERTLARVTFEPGLQGEPTWSPDGQLLAYSSDRSGNLDIWVQQVRGGRAVQVTTGAAHDRQPDWSPDGQQIAFRSERDGGGIYVVPALGGREQRVASFGVRPQWSSDGSQLLLADTEGMLAPQRVFVVLAGGGSPREVAAPRQGSARFQPTWYQQQLVSFWEQEPGSSRFTITVQSVDGSVRHSLQLDDADYARLEDAGLVLARFRWSPSGDRLYLEGGSGDAVASTRWLMNLWRVTVDPTTFRLVGLPERLTNGMTVDRGIAVSRDGRHLAFTPRTDTMRIWSVPLDDTTRAVSGTASALTESSPSVAPFDVTTDGKMIAYCARPAGKDAQQLWILMVDTGQQQLLSEVRECFVPRFSPDGAWISFRRERYTAEEERRRLNGADYGRFAAIRTVIVPSTGGEERPLGDDLAQAYGWSPDGESVLGTCRDSPNATWTAAVCVAPVRHQGPARVLISDSGWHLFQSRYSPDGRWILMNAVSAAGRSLSVVAVASTAGHTWNQVTDEGGWADKPRWSPDGRMIYYVGRFEPPYYDVGALRFDRQTGTVQGPPIRVTRFNRSGHMLAMDSDSELGVAAGRLVVDIQESTGSVWLIDNVDR